MSRINLDPRSVFFFLLILTPALLFPLGGDYWRLDIEGNVDFTFYGPERSPPVTSREYVEAFDRRPLLNLGLGFFGGPWNFYAEATIISLLPPVVLDINSVFSPMVKLGFLEYDDGLVYVGIGRRKQSMGVSDYNLSVNRAMPFFDGINISVGKAAGFRFDSLISVANLTRYSYTKDYSKYFMYHGFSYVGQTWFLMIAEGVTIANPKSLLDFNIFPNAHNEHSECTNVTMEVQAAKTFFDGRLFLYAMGIIDDLPFTDEDNTVPELLAYPNAVAWGAGVRWQVFSGEPFASPSSDNDKGIRRNTEFGRPKPGGLYLSLDYATASRWMYTRPDAYDRTGWFAGQGSFYNYFYNGEFMGPQGWYSAPYGLPSGGDSTLFAFRAAWENPQWKAALGLDLLLLGADARARAAYSGYQGNSQTSDDEDSPYFVRQWLSSGDIQPEITLSASLERGIFAWLSAFAGCQLRFSRLTDTEWAPPAWRINFGASARL